MSDPRPVPSTSPQLPSAGHAGSAPAGSTQLPPVEANQLGALPPAEGPRCGRFALRRCHAKDRLVRLHGVWDK